MRQNTCVARGARIAVRLSRENRVRIDEVVKARGYTSPSAFIRAAIQNELSGRPEPQAIARAKDRYHRLMKTAGQTMSGNALAALQDLVGHGTN